MNTNLLRSLALCTALAAGLAGCANRPGTPPAPGTEPAPSSPSLFGGLFGSGLSPALEAQRTRLQDVLRGTPVVIEATSDKRLRVEVPLRHAFDPGRSAVKPAAAAVLDQLATGFKPHAAVTELRIAAPAEEKASPQLVTDRGASTRDYLVARGVPISRIAGIERAAGAGLEIVLGDRPVNK